MRILYKKYEGPKEHLFTLTKKDFMIQTFRSGGPGGQHQNKVSSGVRIMHKASGAIGESRTDKSQHRNKGYALRRLVVSPKFRIWLNKVIDEMYSGETIEQKVDKAMNPENLLIEAKADNGAWALLLEPIEG
jgi:hypothetical protein